MTPVEAQRAHARLQVIGERRQELDRAVAQDPEVVRLRGLLSQAEAAVRARVRPQEAALSEEADRLQDGIRQWEKNRVNAEADLNFDHARAVTRTLVERIERPRCDPGVDWGATRAVLARYGALELWWRWSGKRWGDQLHSSISMEGCLFLANTVTESRIRLEEGGRLSQHRLLGLAGRINHYFGIPDVAESLDWRKTLLIEDVVPASA